MDLNYHNKDELQILIKEKYGLISPSGYNGNCYKCGSEVTKSFIKNEEEIFNMCMSCGASHTMVGGYEEIAKNVFKISKEFIELKAIEQLKKNKFNFNNIELINTNDLLNSYFIFKNKIISANGICNDVYEKIINKTKPITLMPDDLKLKLNNKLENAHVFKINNHIMEILSTTPNKNTKRKLPFNNVFLDVIIPPKFFYDNQKLIDGFSYICGIWITNFENDIDFWFYKPPIFDEGEYIDHGFLYHWEGDENKFYNFIRNLIFNFLDFLNNPEVELISVERTKEQNDKRIKRGKQPIPTIHNIKVSGKLKIYLDHLNSNPDFKYSHRFDVRGHWRMLRSDRWGKHKGTKIWIPPYIKGEGIYVKKNYEVKKC